MGMCGWCFDIISHLVDPCFFSASYRSRYDSLRTIFIDEGPRFAGSGVSAGGGGRKLWAKKRDIKIRFISAIYGEMFSYPAASLSIAPRRRKNAIEVETEHKVLIFTSTKLRVYVVRILRRREKSLLTSFVSVVVRSATRTSAFPEVEKKNEIKSWKSRKSERENG